MLIFTYPTCCISGIALDTSRVLIPIQSIFCSLFLCNGFVFSAKHACKFWLASFVVSIIVSPFDVFSALFGIIFSSLISGIFPRGKMIVILIKIITVMVKMSEEIGGIGCDPSCESTRGTRTSKGWFHLPSDCDSTSRNRIFDEGSTRERNALSGTMLESDSFSGIHLFYCT